MLVVNSMKAIFIMLIIPGYGKVWRQNWENGLMNSTQCAENEHFTVPRNVFCCDIHEVLLQNADKDGNIVLKGNDEMYDDEIVRLLAPNVCLSVGTYGHRMTPAPKCVCNEGFDFKSDSQFSKNGPIIGFCLRIDAKN